MTSKNIMMSVTSLTTCVPQGLGKSRSCPWECKCSCLNYSSHASLVDYHMDSVYLIGGMVQGGEGAPDPNNKPEGMSDEDFAFRCQYPGKIISDVYKRPKDGEWEKVLDLGKPRCDMEVLMVGTKIFVYGGYNGLIKGRPLCTTEIEIIDTHTKTVTSAEYRLPLGVCGTSVAWHGDDILMIGGKRQGNKSKAVMKLDFVDKTILSLRDLNEDRSNSITIPVQYDQVMVLGGAGREGTKCGELRQWDESIQDYRWKNWGMVAGSENIINPDEYSTVATTFCVNGGVSDNFPAFDLDSNFVFGNEESPFLMEITGDMKTKFYPAPMRL